nr:DUF1614 domain-containing protein [Thermococcus sp.]
MMNKRMFIPPVALPIIVLMLFTFLLLFVLFSGIATAAFAKLGIPPAVALTLFLFSILGSFINIPIAEERAYEPVLQVKRVVFLGIPYPVPYFGWEERRVVIAVNVGGALVPLSIVIYELTRTVLLGEVRLLFNTLLAVVIAVLLSHVFARPVRGLGIAIPMLIPPLVALGLALVLGGSNPPLVAYTSGTMGVLIGADLMNLNKIKTLGASMISIGGAGTFDGIFLAGLIALLLV